MINKINIEIDVRGNITKSTNILAKKGENLSKQLHITLPEIIRPLTIYIDFEKANGEKYRTEPLFVGFESDYVEYDIHSALLDVKGTIKAEVIAKDNDSMVWKSNTMKFEVLEAIEATEELVINTVALEEEAANGVIYDDPINIIEVRVNENGSTMQNAKIIAKKGENYAKQLHIILPDKIVNKWIYLDFELPNGEKKKSYRLEVVNGEVNFDVVNSMLQEEGKLKIEVVAQDAEGFIWKSDTIQFEVGDAINAVNEVEEALPDFVTKAQEILDDLKIYGSDKYYMFVQSVASDTWTITHNLKKYPSVTITDSAGTVVEGEVNYLDENTVMIKFNGSFAGKAIFN